MMKLSSLSVVCALLTALLLTGCAADLRTSPQAQLRLSPQPPAKPGSLSQNPAAAPLQSAPPLASRLNEGSDDDELEAELAPGEHEDGLVVELEGDDLDPETLEDNAVLQANGLSAPEEEGETVFLATDDFDFPVVDNEKVRYFVDYFTGRAHKVVRTWLERSARYLPMMQEVFAEQGLPLDLVYLAMIESGFNNKAFSRAKASGQWQFMEATGKAYGLSNDWWRDERRDPEKATRAAARHLADLYRMFDGDWYLALAAYNAGAGKISRAIKLYETRDFWQLTHGSYLKPETKNYVPKMLAGLLIAKNPERYGFTDLAYHEPLAYEAVELDSVTDLEVIAKLADSDYETIKKLNPEIKRWSTPPGVERYQVRLPVGSGEAFVERYAQLPKEQRANFVVHKIKKGDTPGALAKRYGVRTSELLSVNKIRDARSLRIGQNLLIPLNPEAGKMSLAELREALHDDPPTARHPAGSTHYTVKSGDSLWSIAKRFKVSEKQLRGWNSLGSKAPLKVGQKLVVASGKAPSSSSGKAKVATGQPTSAQTKKIVYQVRPGDNLWSISRQFDVATQQILDWNRLSKSSVLYPGQRLTLLVKNTPRG
jgi:membrane-bound lytic murein transglycosylase D